MGSLKSNSNWILTSEEVKKKHILSSTGYYKFYSTDKSLLHLKKVYYKAKLLDLLLKIVDFTYVWIVISTYPKTRSLQIFILPICKFTKVRRDWNKQLAGVRLDWKLLSFTIYHWVHTAEELSKDTFIRFFSKVSLEHSRYLITRMHHIPKIQEEGKRQCLSGTANHKRQFSALLKWYTSHVWPTRYSLRWCTSLQHTISPCAFKSP